METPCKTEDDCPTPTWCRGKDRCPKRDAKEQPSSGSARRLVRLFRNDNRFAGGQYTVKGIELNLPCGKLQLGRMIFPPPIKPPSIAYIGRRHTWTWTLRVWTVAISYLPNAKHIHPEPTSQDNEQR